MNTLFKPISQLLKLQPHTIKALERLGLYLVRDLLLHKPHNYLTRSLNPNLSALKHGDHIITEVTIRDVQQPKRRGAPLKIYADNDTGSILLIFFNKLHPFIFNQLRVGMKRIVEGKVELNDFYYQISHPDLIVDRKHVEGIESIYPLTHSINNKQLHGYVLKALDTASSEHKCASVARDGREGFTSQLLEALNGIHVPKSLSEIETHTKTLARLELLANQLTLSHIRKLNNTQRGAAFPKAKELQDKILKGLQFRLSSGQEDVIKEIEADQASKARMTRMLQGDVGSGKTLVALMTMLNVAEQGKQSALMAPTDLLATQHFAFFSKALGNYAVALLTGKTKPAERRDILTKLESGEILMLIGTHALFQSRVIFGNLGYIIIDEQHRFGVQQRLELLAKADNPDLLLMTATPIPRSLTLTLFGDMAVSRLMTKPQNRPEIKTIATPKSKTEEVINALSRKIQANEKVYWICPLIEQDDAEDDHTELDSNPKLSDVISRFNTINELYPEKAALLHGKLPSAVKDDIMMRFKNGDINILVSTTVIEVGIDVPDATLIVIENAERFGLAQLHQLRGRVGRGELLSHCILLYAHLGGMIKERIEIMRTSNDGFYIAEEDLKLRGGGEVLGMKQSGQREFRFADLTKNMDLLINCSKEAEKIQDSADVDLLMRIFDGGLIERGLVG